MAKIVTIKPGANILEPSCGSGAFLDALYQAQPDLNITGIELSHELSGICSLCYPGAEIINADALELLADHKGKYDLVIGNPPFGSYKKYPGHDKAASLESMFVELAVNSLKEDGGLALILPDGVLANQKHQKLRQWVLEECQYLATISLPPETFHLAGTSVKTSIIHAKKEYRGIDPDYQVFMALCENIVWNSRGQPTTEDDLPKITDEHLKFRLSEQHFPAEPEPGKAIAFEQVNLLACLEKIA